MYGPSSVSVPLAGGRVNISSDTAYPFAETVTMTIATEEASAKFPLHLRIPGWCDQPTLTVNSVAVAVKANAKGFHVEARAWVATRCARVTRAAVHGEAALAGRERADGETAATMHARGAHDARQRRRTAVGEWPVVVEAEDGEPRQPVLPER